MTRIPFALAFAILLGCNTAQVMEPPDVDAGAALCLTDVSMPLCDAGGVTVGCVADRDSGYGASSGLAEGQTVPYGCKVQRSELAGNPVACSIYSECICEAPDGGAPNGEGGAPSTAGTWACSTSR